MRGADGTALVFLTAGALAREKVGPGAFDASAFDWLVDVKHNLLAGGEFDGFLVVIDAELGVMELAAAIDEHHGASVTGLDVVDAVCSIVVVSGF